MLTCCQQYNYARKPDQHTLAGFSAFQGGHTLLATADDIERYTAAEAAHHLGISTAAICNRVRRGQLRPTGIDHMGHKTYRKADLDKARAR